MKIKLFIILIISVQAVLAQHSQPDELQAFKINNRINFDGVLDDSIWQQATHISNFTQRELNFGKPASERTEVAVAYSKNELYIGVWCYQENASKIKAIFMSPDFYYEIDDNFQIMLSPFDDNRSGYLFIINPNGARADVLISGGEDGNMDWNGVWDTRTTVTDSGWFAEVVIPFSTLQFKSDSILNWALNFERNITSKNEQVLWQGWSRDYSIFSVVKAGRLTGLRNISYAKKFELKPYLLFGRHFDNANGVSYPFKVGGNLNVNILPTLKLNLTTFTDFAQVEADEIPVNLTRFSIYYDEKRQFFLEGYNLYDFYLGDNNHAFYSRQLGITNSKQVPIVAGSRLFGTIGKNNIGFLNIQEAEIDSVPTTNNTVFRYKRNIGEQSYIGGIFTNLINTQHSNQVIGIDAVYQSSKFLKDKNLTIRAATSTSMQDFKITEDAMTYRLSADYPNDLVDNFMALGSMQDNFNPELGYIHRTNYNSYSWHLRVTPRWFSKYGIKRLLLKPWGFTAYQTHTTGELESFSNETRPVGAILKSGERFEFNLIQNYDRLNEDFELTEDINIPVGKYMMYNNEFQFESFRSRLISSAITYNWGDFYTGKIKTLETDLGLSISKYLTIYSTYTRNWIEMQQESIITNEIASFWDIAFTTRLNISLFAQYNDLDEIMIYNIRLHWIPKIGSDFYFVYNIGYEEPIKQIDYLKPTTTDAVMKLVYRITF